MSTIEQITKRMETRKRNTERAKKDIGKILDWVSLQIKDEVTGYETEHEFKIIARQWNGHSWNFRKGGAVFKLQDGKAVIAYDTEYVDTTIYIEIEEIGYIDIQDAASALEEFLNSLTEITIFEKSSEKLRKVVAELETTE